MRLLPSPPKQRCPPNAPVKGNQSGLYHVPGGAYYVVTNPEEYFATAEDAEAAGYEASSRVRCGTGGRALSSNPP